MTQRRIQQLVPLLLSLAFTAVGLAQVTSESARPLHQGSPGVSGGPESGDHFGLSNVAGDFNADGFLDLAVGVPHETFDGVSRVGVVQIFYGTSSVGPQAVSPNDQLFSQATPGVPGDPEADDAWGTVLAVADFDDDGYDDLAIGTPFEAIGPQNSAGAVTILFGGANGLTTAGAQLFYQGYAGNIGPATPEVAEPGDLFGFALVTGDFDGDGYDDLAAGAPGEDQSEGIVLVFTGSASGLTVPSTGTVQIRGSFAQGGFGFALASGDFDLDGRHDLAVGAPQAKPSSAATGVVDIFAGSATFNLTPNRVDRFAGVGNLGWTLAAGRINALLGDDLLLGAPADGPGSVAVLYGGPGGLRAAQNDEVSVVRAPAGQTNFGIRLAAERLNNDGILDVLVVGLLPSTGAGILNIFPGNASDAGLENAPQGPRVDLIQKLQAGKYGIPGDSNSDNGFGWSVAAGQFRGPNMPRQLALGYPTGPSGDTDGGTVLVFDTDGRGPGACIQSPTRRCMLRGRFGVELDWTTGTGSGSAGIVQQGTDDSALLWFFSEDNWEMLVKMLDACAINGHFWVYAAPTTDVGYTLRVTDAESGLSKSYTNALGQPAQAIADVNAFPCPTKRSILDDEQASESPGGPATRPSPASSRGTTATVRPIQANLCVVDEQTVCLQNGQIEVTVDFAAPGGPTTAGKVAGPATDDSGLFWFFADDNWEMLVKVLDACSFNDRYWIYAGAATDVRYTLRVRNVISGQTVTFSNPQGNLARSITDTSALACAAI